MNCLEERVLACIYTAIDEVNKLREVSPIRKEPSSVLIGRLGQLDSLGLVNFIVTLEQIVNEKFSTHVTIADERAMSQRSSPFLTISSVSNYLTELLREQGHA